MDNALKLFSVKLIHTAIWLFMVTVIVYVLYCGLADDVNPYTWIAIGLVVAEGLVLLVLWRSLSPDDTGPKLFEFGPG